jgi:hypothetical protein
MCLREWFRTCLEIMSVWHVGNGVLQIYEGPEAWTIFFPYLYPILGHKSPGLQNLNRLELQYFLPNKLVS